MHAKVDGQRAIRCPVCGNADLRVERRTERFEYDGDQGTVWVVATDVPVDVCPSCGEVFSGREAGRIRDEAICRALGLLTPAEVRALRERLGLSLADLANLTGIEEKLLHDLEDGRQIQSRAIDRYLRLLDKDPDAVTHLATVR